LKEREEEEEEGESERERERERERESGGREGGGEGERERALRPQMQICTHRITYYIIFDSEVGMKLYFHCLAAMLYVCVREYGGVCAYAGVVCIASPPCLIYCYLIYYYIRYANSCWSSPRLFQTFSDHTNIVTTSSSFKVFLTDVYAYAGAIEVPPPPASEQDEEVDGLTSLCGYDSDSVELVAESDGQGPRNLVN